MAGSALVYSTLPSGAEVLLSSWITLGETVRVPLAAPGDVAVDVAWKGPDDAPSTLVGVTVLGYEDQLVEVEAVAVRDSWQEPGPPNDDVAS